MIQKQIFDGGVFIPGSFVLHKITGRFTGHCSAWYSPEGTLEDCEQILRDGRVRSIRPNKPLWRKLEKIGLLYKGKKSNTIAKWKSNDIKELPVLETKFQTLKRPDWAKEMLQNATK
jgi:hypothetical protein